ncbi:receptor-type tyrosine-protein phosphatase C isoform X1 [Silurus asotus]|uniref:Receptor-type tyrosine-protein phosphatase C n=1 Tax=Silurus asotus TaxID=30991 RepID=A0AAD5FB56_SILAS|nr:receptor-type tyrosine-protein phosphatase C isoform X1 [Silurus asotus]
MNWIARTYGVLDERPFTPKYGKVPWTKVFTSGPGRITVIMFHHLLLGIVLLVRIVEKGIGSNELLRSAYGIDVNANYYMLFGASFRNDNVPLEPTKPIGIKAHLSKHNSVKVKCEHFKMVWNGIEGHYRANLYIDDVLQDDQKENDECDFLFENLYYLTKYKVEVYAVNRNDKKSESTFTDFSTSYNDKAILGILGFLIVVTTVALLFVLYKIYILKREKSRNEQEMDDLLPANTLIPVEPMSADALLEAYKRKRADEGRLFMEEFQSVPRIFSNYSVREAKKSENQSKNRYIDILPYDYNRVILSHGETNDYINASFIEGYKESNKYIAAQGPKEETMADFWTMIWEQKTSIIVMVTRCEEGNKNKCAQYWPSMERETEIFDDLVVKIKGEENCPNYIIRHLTMMNRREKSAEREVTHIQFTSWPDHGVPSDPGLLLKLRRRVNSFKNFFSGPIVIHCSAGVGRTGTYIGIDAMIESLEAEGRVDIYGYVVKLRRQRCLMVQVEAQYVLIHTALIEYSQFGETEMSLSNFHSEVNTLRQKDGNESSLIEMEFQKLPRFKNYRASNAARTEENKKKNRSSVIPYDFNRVSIKVEDESSHESDADDEEEYSSDEEDDALTKYINASYVDGYWSPNSFIVAQGPMADTVADFLQMLYQKKVKSVFMLSDCTENDVEFCSQYWDDEKKTFEEMTVEVKETENFPTYIRRCLEIQHTKRKDSHTLQQYHFLKWTGLELPANPLELIDMMKSIRQSSDSSKVENLPIVAHCNDGSSRSGIFCALWKLLDSADTEKLVDIFQVVKDLRKSRLGMINTLEQYEFLYTALEGAYPMQNGEVKKPSEAPADSVQVVNESTALITPSTDAVTTESAPESTDPAPPEEGATEAKPEPEKTVSESTTNGPTTTVEV